jgi:hypothetical protein
MYRGGKYKELAIKFTAPPPAQRQTLTAGDATHTGGR